ncbi:MAG TPA: histidine kinase [Candidatus Limnocylindrales bacterium]|nr:histidine kinase [Candidatus Limnocylindrales bacterium]
MASTLSTPRGRTTVVWARALLLVGAGALGMGMLVGNAQLAPLDLATVLEVLVGWSFAACGIFIWARRPANRLGPLMTIVGMLWLLGRTMTLVPNAFVYPAGLWLTDLWAAGFALFLLSFPTGRLTSRADLAIVGIFLFVTVPLELLWLLFLVPPNGLNGLGIAANESAAHLIDTLQRVTISLGSVLLVGALGRRWLRSSGPVRRQMAPVLVGAVAILLQSASWIYLSSGTSIEPLDDLIFLAQIAIPIAILTVILRARIARAGIADLVVELGQTPTPARLRDALANALGDASLQVAYWSPIEERFVDAAGRTMELPGEGADQAVTMLERNGVPEAAIIHDAILLEEPGLIASVASAMRLAVENDRLTAAVETQLAEVRASRARIVAAGDAERRRVERDLHDGAQQRLVALTLALRLARTRLGDDADPAVRLSLEQASDEAKAALAELRELARGIHPQILTEAGLHAAIESLAARTSATVAVDIDPDARFAPAVEAIAYFVVSESLANIVKHAEAATVQVRAGWQDGILTVEVADDGRGGADPRTGTGLRGLLDRVSAADGTLDVVSPSGGGTRIVARIPAAPPTHGVDRTTARSAT